MSARLTAAYLALTVQLGLGLVTVGLSGCKPPAPPVPPADKGDKTEGGQPPATPPMSVGTPADTSVPPEGALAGEVLEPVPPGTPPPKPLEKPILPPVAPEAAPAPSPRLVTAADAAQLGSRIQSFFAGQVGRRIYLQVDKPLYKPGETLWVKAWNLATRNFAEDPALAGMWVELVSPKGAVVVRQRVRAQQGVVQTGIDLSAGLAGGEYTLRVRGLTGNGATGERPVILSSYEPPRLKLKLEFVRKAYGAGDEVTATFEARRPTGEPLANRTLSALVRVDGVDLPRVPVTTDEAGDGLVRFQLPTEIAVGDALLTVLADDGGLTESIAKRVPIIVNHMRFAAFPEGGALVEGLPSRVYFEARTPLNKPADVAGRVVDDQGVSVAKFESVRDGLGRVEFTPARGRTYHTEIDRPVGVSERYPLPPPMIEGCVLRTYDDLDGQTPELRAAVRCSQPRKVTLVAALRERVIDAATVAVEKDAPAIVYLQPPPQDAAAQALARAQGVARLTLFDEAQRPLAERLVYRNRRARLGIKVEPDRPDYAPRDQVSLTVTTTDPQGAPVPAALALSVVDDTVLSYADDKTGHMLSRLYLEPELPGKLEEPNFYFDLREAKSALAMDLLMGARGYRRFEWLPQDLTGRPVAELATGVPDDARAENNFNGLRKGAPPPPPKPTKASGAAKPAEPPVQLAQKELAKAEVADKGPARRRAAADELDAPMPPAKVQRPRDDADAARAPVLAAAPAPTTPPAPAATRANAAATKPTPAPAAEPEAPEPMADRQARLDVAEKKGKRAGPVALGAGGGMLGQRAMMDDDMPMGAMGRVIVPAKKVWRRPPVQWAPVRVFRAPAYTPGGEVGPRTDFRETLLFQPDVRTGADGRATVSFHLSDAITSFRVLTEGVGAEAAGRDEKVIKSSLPFSMAVKLPLEVSAGDKLKLPLVLTNERDQAMQVDLQASFGNLLTLDRPVQRTSGSLAAKSRDALFYPVTVTGRRGQSEVRFTASASGLRDEFVRKVRVTPLGFPQRLSAGGQLRPAFAKEVDLGEVLPGTLAATVKVYPSPVATLLSGMDGMLRQPVGCFEQASSANYPNVMILRLLKESHIDDPRILGRSSGLLDAGYRRLIGYETKERGYEWFGATPGHEALTAYGLVEFSDMKPVYRDVDAQMVRRTADWLRSRRDGKGGYQRDGKSLDTFGRASDAVTNAYITYSLSEARLATDLQPEIAVSARLARDSSDGYLLSLATSTLLNVGDKGEGRAAAKRLAALQDGDGGFTKADHSITRSGGTNLQVETTALAALALMKAGGFDPQVERAVEWLYGHRNGSGAWGATQATVLALKALTQYTTAMARTRAPGEVSLLVNGKKVRSFAYAAGHREPIVFDDLENHLGSGRQRIEITTTSAEPMPFSLGLEYRALRPATSPKAAIGIETALERADVKLGESVRMNVTLTNKTQQGQPMTLARVGLPGGLAFQNWQLKELREKGLIGFYETGPREVVLYLRQMRPGETVRLPLDLLATVPGEYRAPASSAYLYYTDEHKTWVDGTSVRIEP